MKRLRISIAYPPLESEKGVPLLSQNRQFQWFHSPTYIYPMVPASAATLLKSRGFDVSWDDFIAEEKSFDEFVSWYSSQRIDLILIETKTPVVKRHWKIIRQMKEISPETIIVMVGDHVTADPDESMRACPVDFILTGGNYDFLIADLSECLERNQGKICKEELDGGIYYRSSYAEKKEDTKDCEAYGAYSDTGHFRLHQDLSSLPMIDRELTKWRLYSEKNGNYKRLPGTYTMSARDCWYHKCSFCSWTTLYNTYNKRTPDQMLDEIGILIETYGVKEIMDDSGAFPTGEWLHRFCEGMIERGYNKKVIMDCNMRFCALSYDEYRLMYRAGFRFVLFGLESANQKTLDRIRKGEKIRDMIESCRLAKKAGLSPHLTIMFGYPWEGEKQISRTVRLGQYLLKKGYANTLQATIVIPYPGTPLYRQCQEKGWLATEDYDEFDMRRPVMRTPVGDERLKAAVQEVYKVAFSPEFIFRRIAGIRSADDVKFILRAAGKVLGHLTDFHGGKKV